MNTIRIYLLMLALAVKFSTATSQNIPAEYKNFQIQSTSCKILSAINLELNKSADSTGINNLRTAEQNSFPLSGDSDVQAYLDAFNRTLEATKNNYPAQEVFWRASQEIKTYGLSALCNYQQALPTKYLNNYLKPAVQRGFELYIDDLIDSGIENHKGEIDSLITERINLLYSNKIDVRKASNEDRFEQLFSGAHKDIPSLSMGQNDVFNKELNKYAYNLVKARKDSLKLVKLKREQYNQIRNQVNANLARLQKTITENATSEVQKLYGSIVVLTNNQEKINSIFSDNSQSIQNNQVKIAALEGQMANLQGNANALKALQDEHSKLIEQNDFQLDIISGYTLQNLNAGKKIAGLKAGNFDNIFNDSDKAKIIQQLKEVDTTETVLSVSNDVINASNDANAAYNFLTSTNILKGEDAKRVGTALKYITGGVQTGSGVVKLFNGDPSGVLDIFSGLSSLFGHSQASPEMQMLGQIYNQLTAGFDSVNIRLDVINSKIDTLSRNIYYMYNSMISSLQYIELNRRQINEKLNNLQRLTQNYLFKDYDVCRIMDSIRKVNGNRLNSYSDYHALDISECEACLQALNQFTITRDLLYFYAESDKALWNSPFMGYEIDSMYNPVRDLFQSYYSTNLISPIFALMFPVDLTQNSSKALVFLKNHGVIVSFAPADVIGKYYNYELVNEFADYFLTFSGFFEIKGYNHQDFSPLDIGVYLTSNAGNKYNFQYLEIRLIKLLQITEYSIAQQSLLSGDLMMEQIYNSIFGFSTDANQMAQAMNCLTTNKLLAQNFTNYLINKNISFKGNHSVDDSFV